MKLPSISIQLFDDEPEIIRIDNIDELEEVTLRLLELYENNDNAHVDYYGNTATITIFYPGILSYLRNILREFVPLFVLLSATIAGFFIAKRL